MKRIFILFYLFCIISVSAFARDMYLSNSDTLVTGAIIPKEIEDPECLGINKEPYHATLMPYASLPEALKGNRHASPLCMSLNGLWKFNWVAWPQQRQVDFYKPSFDVTSWKEIKVPSNWQVEGYGTPYYSNFNYIFQKDFPRVMSEPPKEFTAFKERNPVGSYRREFTLPASWNGRHTFITFDGVDAGFFLWVNGQKVGYSVYSHNATELEKDEYKIDLPQSNKTVLCVSHLTLVVGSNGCGPRPLEAYTVYAKPTTFSYEIQLISTTK